MKQFIVTWPGTAQTVAEDQLESFCGILTSSGLSHTVEEIETAATDREASPRAASPAKKKTK